MAAATSFPLDDSSPLRTQTPPPNSICLHPSTSLAARKVMRPSLQGALSQNQCISRICFFEMPSPNLPPPPWCPEVREAPPLENHCPSQDRQKLSSHSWHLIKNMFPRFLCSHPPATNPIFSNANTFPSWSREPLQESTSRAFYTAWAISTPSTQGSANEGQWVKHNH